MRNRKNDGIALVSAAGIIVEILKKISDILKALGGEEADLRLVLSKPGLAQKIAEIITAYKHCVEARLTDRVRIMFRHAEMDIILYQFNRSPATFEVLEYLLIEGMKPAEEEHLRALNEARPNFHWGYPVVALGTITNRSVSGDKRICPCLLKSGGTTRIEQVDYDDDQWPENWWFLAVPNAA